MYNFGFGQDPLLFQNIVPKQGNYQEGNDLKQQYDAVITQYQALQQKIQIRLYTDALNTPWHPCGFLRKC